MTNKIITTEGNVQFQLGDGSGKIINVHPFHVYTIFNTDTVTFHLIAIPMSSGLSLFTSKAEDLEVNGTVYTFEELPDALSEAFAIAGAQARAEIVDELPETGMTNTIYLVPKEEGEGYDEYIYLKDEQRWELIGDTSIEFDQFVQKTDFSAYTAATDAKIDAVSGAVSDEASRAISAESALSDSIDALEDYIDTVSGITDDLDGRVDILEESLAQEASARTDADTVLSGAISSVTEDVAALSGDVTAHTSNTDIHVTAADKTAWADKYTQAEVDGIVSGLNDSIDAVSGAVADETARAQSAETALHDEIENIDLSDYYTKAEVDDMSEVAAQAINELTINKLDASAYTPTDLSNYYTKSQTSGATELSTAFAAKAELSALTEDERVWAEALTDINGKIGTISGDVDTIEAVLPNKADTSAVTQAVADEATARANADTALSGAVDTALLGYINGAEYVSTAKTINFLNGETVIDSIDATDFIKDGMVSNVEISGGSLVIEFNTDAGKEDIVIPLTDIFDPSNYYTKSQTSGATELSTAFAAKQNVLTAGENIVISGDVISAEAGNDVTELTQAEYDALVEAGTVDPDVLYIITDAAPINLNNYYQKSETSGKSEISTALAAKLDTTAYTPTDLSNYYTKSETSGATELNTAFSGKQDTLSAGTGIDITSNVISVTGGTGGKAIEAGRGITVTTGETADTVSFNLPISAGTGSNSIIIGESTNISNSNRSIATGYETKAQQNDAFAQGYKTVAGQAQSHAEGYETKAYGVNSHSEGKGTSAMTAGSHAEGLKTITSNPYEHAQGQYNVSNEANTTFGDSGNTLFSVGNGTADNARHNAFEIRQNGDIYITSGGTDIKLQDNLGGGGGGSSINVVQTTGTSSADVMSQDAVTTQLNNKAYKSQAVGSYSFGETNSIPFIKLNKVDTAQSLNEIYYPKINGKGILSTNSTWARNNLLFSLVETSAITTSISSSSTDDQVPSAKAVYDAIQEGGGGSSINVVQTTGTSTGDVMSQDAVTTALSGKADAANLGGLKLQQVTQAEYDALATKDASTLYVIVG